MSSYRTPAVGETVPADLIKDYGLRGSWTPTLTATTTNPTLGTGPTQTGAYTLQNGTMDCLVIIAFGTGAPTAGSGTYLISLPTGFGIHTDESDQIPLGIARIRDASAVTVAYNWFVASDATQPGKVLLRSETGAAVTNAVPWTWAASDSMRMRFRYKTDFS